MLFIYHITNAEAWAKAQAEGEVVAESLVTEGFIHCSREAQLLQVAQRFFAGVDGLLVLAINEEPVRDLLVNEGPAGVGDPFAHDVFPHVYGPIPVTAVVTAAPLTFDSNHNFVWPAALPRA
jgi:uncharacterized protein (DUF952 family)